MQLRELSSIDDVIQFPVLLSRHVEIRFRDETLAQGTSDVHPRRYRCSIIPRALAKRVGTVLFHNTDDNETNLYRG